jgi:hypothetical protein
VSYGVFGADLTFISSEDALLERRAVSASFERRMSETWTLSLGAGAALPGFIEMGGERHAIGAGWLVAISSSWRLLDGRGRVPFFVLMSLTLAGSGVGTERTRPAAGSTLAALPPGGVDAEASMYAVDARLGLIAGKTLWDTLTPYAAVRLFGGPVFWRYRGEDVVGGDKRHVQLALGLSSTLPGGVDLFAEIAPFGERAANVGGGVAF